MAKLSPECKEQLLQQEEEADSDIRLSVRLFHKCLNDKKKFCPDVEPGRSEAIDCLIEHKEDDGFSKECRAEIDGMIERRVRDFRVDSRLRRVCQTDIKTLCGDTGDIIDGDSTLIGSCLQVCQVTQQTCSIVVSAMSKPYSTVLATCQAYWHMHSVCTGCLFGIVLPALCYLLHFVA